MQANEGPGVLIIEGSSNELDQSGLSHQAFMGLIVQLSVFLQIPVLNAVNYSETLQLLKMLAKQLGDLQSCSKVYPVKTFSGRVNTPDKQRIRMLQSIHGLGTSKAVALLKYFGNIRALALAETAELCRVPGIGKHLAQRIHSLFAASFVSM